MSNLKKVELCRFLATAATAVNVWRTYIAHHQTIFLESDEVMWLKKHKIHIEKCETLTEYEILIVYQAYMDEKTETFWRLTYK